MAEENQDSSSGAKKRKLSDCVSKFTNYFNIESAEWQDDSFTLQCLNCPKKIKGNNRSASNFLTHYKNKHYATYSTMLEIGKGKTYKLDPSTSQSPTPTLTKHFPTVLKKSLW